MIRVKVVAPFAIREIDKSGEIELPDQITVGQLRKRLRAPLFAYALPVMVNGKQAGARQRLQQGDLVIFLMPLSGG